MTEHTQVREALELDEVFIFGHSWGSLLAVDYMRTNPEGVRGLILASPVINYRRWASDAQRLLARLPSSTQSVIQQHESAGTFSSDEYQEAMMEYYRAYLLLTDPWPQPVLDSFEQFNQDIYVLMQGPSEFTITGTLRDYDGEDVLPDLDMPVLFTAGEYDEAPPETIEYFASLTPQSRVRIFEDSAHLTMWDAREEYVEVIREFLNGVN